MLHVASVCTQCGMFLHAAAKKRLKPVKRLAQRWELLRPIARSFTDHRNDVKMLIPLAAFTWVLDIKPRANGHKIVGCYMLPPFAHPVTRCCVLLGVVAQFETGQTFSCVQTDARTPNPNNGLQEYRPWTTVVYLFKSLTIIFFPETRNTSNKMRILLACAWFE